MANILSIQSFNTLVYHDHREAKYTLRYLFVFLLAARKTINKLYIKVNPESQMIPL